MIGLIWVICYCCLLLLILQTDAVANHPNQWFQASVNYHKLKSGKSLDDGAPATAATAAATAATAANPDASAEGTASTVSAHTASSGAAAVSV